MALQAAGGFLLALFSIYTFLTYNQMVSEHLIGGVSSRGNENDMTTSLVMSSPMCWLYPVVLRTMLDNAWTQGSGWVGSGHGSGFARTWIQQAGCCADLFFVSGI